ncbi:MAG: TIGR00730 family Rossman fold protein [Verrucomicrobiales bacterium]|nr:TIGR00730 family Rossman fold protein [Verrucomicrobiales bacterium]HQW27679.1 TIGR00730 family Rossman fold protein [Verrucomicrobiales bacterium]
MTTGFSSLCVFCGSQSGTHPAYVASARETGRLLAERGIRLVYGGGSIGMMGAVADACLESGGEVIGVIPAFLMDLELGHPGVTCLEVVPTMLERKLRMAELSDAFITLPGGIGTLDELFEMLTWVRLAVHSKPSGLLNVAGFYDELIAFCGKTQVDGGFISAQDAANLVVDDSIAFLLEKMEEAARRGPSSFYRS